ncbi:MAG: OmpA family protein, partial [Lachnospiraceae bacterium]|nr:OmpA family protein [Lachnospiraceae bacterium]
LEDERQTVAKQKAILDLQQTQLNAQEQQLNAQEEALAEQGDMIALQQKTLKEQHELLAQLQVIMNEQQEKLDNIIGVRSELVEALRKEFEDSNLHVSVDEQTGAITFDSSILFDYNQSDLKPSGEKFLAEFLPRYVDVLLGPKYKNYVSEILIEGHTDTDGDYLSNLELSQKRALSVAEYCLSDDSNVLSEKELDALRDVASATGRSYSNPIKDANGKIDMAASRRVEFLFRLKDEEMVRELIEILNSEQSSSSAGRAKSSTRR